MSRPDENGGDLFDAHVSAHREAVAQMASEEYRNAVLRIAERARQVVAAGGKLVFFGNGGSAADAQHLATEMVVRYVREREAIPAIALTTDTSALTAGGNDYGFEDVFARQVNALVTAGDLVIAISTSGESPNVLKAAAAAKARGADVVGFTKAGGGSLGQIADLLFAAPTEVTAIAQECHIMAGHIVCDVVERSVAAG